MRPRIFSLLIASAVTIAGCGVLPPGGASDASVAMYQRNASEQRMGVLVRSNSSESWGTPEGQGCVAVGVPWTVSFGAAGRDGAVGEYTPLLSSADVSDPMDAVIWIDVAEDGTVTWAEGRPDWAMEGVIARCGKPSLP